MYDVYNCSATQAFIPLSSGQLYEKKANSAFAIEIKNFILVNFEQYFRALFYRKMYKIEIYDLTYPYLCQMTKDREFFLSKNSQWKLEQVIKSEKEMQILSCRPPIHIVNQRSQCNFSWQSVFRYYLHTYMASAFNAYKNQALARKGFEYRVCTSNY